mmetsp:Transcript_13132/g.36271  ORF Transcript_13132/g.36271 Transcript_13132/m.36271 type:complete len:134 (-) Transcript_13132:14-415(-)
MDVSTKRIDLWDAADVARARAFAPRLEDAKQVCDISIKPLRELGDVIDSKMTRIFGCPPDNQNESIQEAVSSFEPIRKITGLPYAPPKRYYRSFWIVCAQRLLRRENKIMLTQVRGMSQHTASTTPSKQIDIW